MAEVQTTIYAVSAGYKDENHVVAVFSSRAKAHVMAASSHDMTAAVEEFPLDPDFGICRKTQVWMYRDGSLAHEPKVTVLHWIGSIPLEAPSLRSYFAPSSSGGLIKTSEYVLRHEFLTDDIGQAIKATDEWRTRLVTTDMWPDRILSQFDVEAMNDRLRRMFSKEASE